MRSRSSTSWSSSISTRPRSIRRRSSCSAPRDARHYNAIPIRFLADADDHLLVGVADPTDVGVCDELRMKLGGAVSLVVVDQVELHRTLAREYA